MAATEQGAPQDYLKSQKELIPFVCQPRQRTLYYLDRYSPVNKIFSQTEKKTNKVRLQSILERPDLNLTDFGLEIFTLVNEVAFQNRLDESSLYWNTSLQEKVNGVTTLRNCRLWIILSPTAVDCQNRLLKTLIHEMCHAINYITIGQQKAGHGPIFQETVKYVEDSFDNCFTIPINYVRYGNIYRYWSVCLKCGCQHGFWRIGKKKMCKVCKSTEMLITIPESRTAKNNNRIKRLQADIKSHKCIYCK